MPVQPNKKVLASVQGNKLTLGDIRKRKKYWNKPQGYYTECQKCNWKIVDAGYWKKPTDPSIKEMVWQYYDGEQCGRCNSYLKNIENEENYMDFVCYTGWKCWSKDYKFLPMLDKYNKIKEAVNKDLDEYKAKFRAECVKKFKDPAEEHTTIQEFQNKNGQAKHLKEVDKEFDGGSFRLMPYFVVANANNTMTVITQNTRQLDFHDKRDIVFFWRGNKFVNKAKTVKDKRLLYWVTSITYIDDKKATCILTLKRDPMWSYYGNVVESKAHVKVFVSQLGNSHEEIEKDPTTHAITKQESLHKEDYNSDDEKYCRACDNCFDFCGDLRNKACKYVGKGGYDKSGAVMSWQPTYKIGMAIPSKLMGKVVIKGDNNDDNNNILVVPNSICVLQNNDGERRVDKFFGDGGNSKQNPTLYYLLDGYHFDKNANKGQQTIGSITKSGGGLLYPNASGINKIVGDPNTFSMYWPNDGNDITKKNKPEFPNSFYWDELPRAYGDQPHLLNHSSAQVYFQRKLLFTANWKHLLVRRKKDPRARGEKGITKQGMIWVLGYRMKINSSIAGILYSFESGDIFFKWEVKVQGSYQDVGFLDFLLNKLFAMIGMGDESDIQAQFSGQEGEKGGFWQGLKNLWTLLGVGFKSWIKKQIGTDFGQMFTADRYKKMSGVKEKNSNDKDQKDSEGQTERMKKSTAKAQNRVIEPAIFYTNTIDLAYDFFEYGNRSMNNPFEVRAEHSKLLHDNLVNNNNKNPIQSFDIRVRHLKQCIAKGEWQAEVDLFDFDTKDDWFRSKAGAGIFFYDDLKEFFPDWQPVFKTEQSSTRGETGNAGGGQGQEEVEIEIKKGKKILEELLSADMTNADYGIADFLGSPDANLWAEMPHCHVTSYGSGGKSCLGCLCGGGSHGDPNYNYEKVMEFSSGGTLVLKTRGSGEQSCTVPDGGGKVVFWAKGNQGGISLETTTPDTKNMKFNFKEERVTFEKEEEYKQEEYKEPDFTPSETELDVDVDIDVDADKEDMDTELEEFGDRDAGERDDDEDFDKDLDKDDDKDKDNDIDFELDGDEDDDQDPDDDKDDDTDKDPDKDKDDDMDRDGDDDNDNDADAIG